ncbi:fimbrial protein [Serratia fonticola]|uniref:fimbrial protein n=1 Tax=Serratia fonticola TaxID=47917 RepID=UPI00217730A7|nr:fimbrial protein [Serratia fonticola]CAI1547421.1 fimbrial protein FimI [Serratia fonticola]
MSSQKNTLAALLLTAFAGMSMNANAAPSAEVTLQGTITNTTCDVTINGGKSTLNIGVFKTNQFTSANTQIGSVPMNVTLSNCAADESGNLIVQGITSVANNDKNLFVNADADTVGFMIKDAAAIQVTANNGPTVDVEDGIVSEYAFQVGMGSSTTAPVAGAYSAPIVVAYIVN